MIPGLKPWLAFSWWLTAATTSTAFTWWLVGWTKRHSILDVPNERSSHSRATPRGGGLAVVAVTAVSALLAWTICWPQGSNFVPPLLVSSLGIAYVSWLDDLTPLSSRIRFVTHLCGALVIGLLVGPLETIDLGPLGKANLGSAALPLTLLWLTGMTNAVNFMDGIDGIAGLTAAIAGSAIGVAAACTGQNAAAVIGLGFSGAALGFLFWNWSPARIFMGDVGSAFCGFVIAALPLCIAEAFKPPIFMTAALVMWPFLFDSVFTVSRRLCSRENVFTAHRSHLYQKMVAAGASHQYVSGLYGVLALCGAALGLYLMLMKPVATLAMPAVAAYLLGTVILLLSSASVARYAIQRQDRAGQQQRRDTGPAAVS